MDRNKLMKVAQSAPDTDECFQIVPMVVRPCQTPRSEDYGVFLGPDCWVPYMHYFADIGQLGGVGSREPSPKQIDMVQQTIFPGHSTNWMANVNVQLYPKGFQVTVR
jgi:hypothetical protein